MFLSKRRTVLFLSAVIVGCYLFATAPPIPDYAFTEEPPIDAPLIPQCGHRHSFANLTQNSYFIFPKTAFSDANVFSNLFFFLGLKYQRTFALNVEHPLHWNGITMGQDHASEVQETPDRPRVICQEIPYAPPFLDIIFKGQFQKSQKVVLGFLRDPIEVFLACLMEKVEHKRRHGDKSVSIMLDKNVASYLDGFLGNVKDSKIYISSQTCNNPLSFTLGLTDHDYKTKFSYLKDPSAPQRWADHVQQTIGDFLIYERLQKSLFMFREKHCLGPTNDWLYLPRVRETFVGLGLGKISPDTKSRLVQYLRYDYAVYNRILQQFDKTFNRNLRIRPYFSAAFFQFKEDLQQFTSRCCLNTMTPDDHRERTYQLTTAGEESIQCSMINANNRLTATIVLQIQEAGLGSEVRGMINSEGRTYADLLQRVQDSLPPEDPTTG